MSKEQAKHAKLAKKLADKNQDDGHKNEDVKIQHDEVKVQDGPRNWYDQDVDEDDEDDEGDKWTYMEHHGVKFQPPYHFHDFPLDYGGTEVRLTPEEEELAWYWCQTLGTDYETSEFYRKNFIMQFMKRFVTEGKHTDFNKFDFSKMKAFMEKIKEQRKNKSDAEKAALKLQKDRDADYYGYAIVDDLIERVNAYVIELPTLFKGRGEHPQAGLIKPRVQPENISLNLAENAPIPICEVPGHSWGQIVTKRDVTWLSGYRNILTSSSSSNKYIFLAANSRFKGQNDRKKYEKARRLKNQIERIRTNYMRKIESKDLRDRQLGTATYLIDTLALRVGNDKSQEEADTVGCCSLRIEHIEAMPDSMVKLDFPGKDSMQYKNTVKVHPLVWKNIHEFTKGKSKRDDLFDSIDAPALNEYLKSLMEGLTAKVFRTYNASSTLQRELKKVQLEGLSMEEKLTKYEEANKQVAILCNHQKTVGKKFIEGLKKREEFITAEKEYFKELEKHISQFTAKRDKINKDQETLEIDGKKLVKKFPQTKEQSKALLQKLQERIAQKENELKKRDANKEIALDTSKINYNDPRITVAWCKKNEVKIEKVFTKNLLSKFVWAMYSDVDYEF